MLITSKKGQAITEFLPACIILFMVMTAALSYYRVMRAASIRQEVVRNLTFAKIRNSGPLTTTPDQLAGGSGSGLPRLNMERISVSGGRNAIAETPVMNAGNHDFIRFDSNCFTVYPADPKVTIKLGPLMMAGDLGDLDFSTYAVMYRGPGGGCP